MSVVSVTASNSEARQPLYEPNRRLYSKTALGKPGLEDEIVELPKSIIDALRQFLGGTAGGNVSIGGEIAAWSTTQITTKRGFFLTDDAVYYLENFILTPNAASYWGFFELELVAVSEGDSVSLDFYDDVSDAAGTAVAASKKIYKVNVYENYETSAAFPSLTAGRIKWVEYKRASAGGDITEVAHLLNSYTTSDRDIVLNADRRLKLQSGGALEHDGVPVAGYSVDGGALRTAVIEIGDWDMDADAVKYINVPMAVANIRRMYALIRNDADSLRWPLEHSDGSGANIGWISIPDMALQQVALTRLAAGAYDTANYDSTSYNRGWLYIEYVD